MHSAQLYLSPHQNVRAEQGHNASKGLALRMELGNVMAGEGEREGSEGTQGRGKWDGMGTKVPRVPYRARQTDKRFPSPPCCERFCLARRGRVIAGHGLISISVLLCGGWR
jgi:hypothetical protein